MGSDVSNLCGCQWSTRLRAWMACVLLSVIFEPLNPLPAFADGCFVFRWNKDIDIKEPSQKAIIVFDAGREDLLLQVKYEGPLEEFGWLIPVPSLPSVEKGSMQPFYELSQLTQQQWGDHAYTLGATTESKGEEAVKVIEIKTVGAYEVAVLSAQEAGSLQRWLEAHDYSTPQGISWIVQDYVLNGWYFIAAKINLSKSVSLKEVPAAAPKDPSALARSRNAVRRQLGSGELHPLLISFDTPRCIYPLRISALGGKPSEVSLYVLSAEARLDQFLLERGLDGIHHRQDARDRFAKEHESLGQRSMQNMQSLRLAAMMYSLASPGTGGRGARRDWSLEDLQAVEKESSPNTPLKRFDQDYAGAGYALLHYLPVSAATIPQCIKALPRLKNKRWYLTKHVWTFQPQEMHDLEFEPAIPLLASALPDRAGGLAAGILPQLGAQGASALITACRSTNRLQRIHASFGLASVQSPDLVELLLMLFKDDAPEIRFNAVMAAPLQRDERLIDPLIALFRDSYPQIRQQAAQWLSLHEPTNRAPVYVALLHDPDLEVRACALHVLLRSGQNTISRPDLLHLLGDPRIDVVTGALSLLQGRQASGWAYSSGGVSSRLPALREGTQLTSAEAAPLTTNLLIMARLMGLKILDQNADAEAVALTLPLLRDKSSVVRNRASALLQTVTGQDIAPTEPAAWEKWWAANKDTFVARKQSP
jgi:hypothetical protein